MTERSLRLFLPLVLLVTMLVVGAGSLAYALHQKQRDLTASERLNLLRDVAHLVRLADELPPGTSDLLAEEVAQVARRLAWADGARSLAHPGSGAFAPGCPGAFAGLADAYRWPAHGCGAVLHFAQPGRRGAQPAARGGVCGL